MEDRRSNNSSHSPPIRAFPDVDGRLFYSAIRNGLLHQAQTKQGWKIRTGESRLWNDTEKIVDRTKFANALKSAFDQGAPQCVETDLSVDACLPSRRLEMVGHQHVGAWWFRPFNRKLGKTKSSFAWYGVSLRHACSESASSDAKARAFSTRCFWVARTCRIRKHG